MLGLRTDWRAMKDGLADTKTPPSLTILKSADAPRGTLPYSAAEVEKSGCCAALRCCSAVNLFRQRVFCAANDQEITTSLTYDSICSSVNTILCTLGSAMLPSNTCLCAL